MKRIVAGAVGLVVLAASVSCSAGGSTSSAPGSSLPGNHPVVDASAPVTDATFTVTPGVQQVVVTGAAPRAPLTLVDAQQRKLVTMVADERGRAAFVFLPADYTVVDPALPDGGLSGDISGGTIQPADGFTVRDESVSPVAASRPFRVLSTADHPPTSSYESQQLRGVHWKVTGGPADGTDARDGFQYVTVRDGVKIGVMVRFPDPALYGDGPYPTVVEYSGYSPSDPDNPQPGTMIANALGFATVGVNMRGSGCSGGVFDTFSPAQSADGYDVIETVARQPWVAGHRVGMVGLSYAGISQLYVASTRPPSLAAIAPQSVIADGWGQVWPGGLYNTGFTKQWLLERDRQARPNGQSWTQKQIAAGDDVCAGNQDLRTLNVDFEKLYSALHDRPAAADEKDLRLLVREIDRPVFLTGAWQDEQTGGRFATMLGNFTSAPVRKFTVFNGRHPDGYTPITLTRWYEFLSFYVARKIPRLSPLVRAGAPALFESEFKVAGLGFEPDRFAEFGDDQYDAALAKYEAEKPVRVLFENGAGRPDAPGAPAFRFEAGFDSFPPAGVSPQRWYLDADGSLSTSAPAATGVDTYLHDPGANGVSYSGSGAHDFQAPMIDYDWPSDPQGRALSYLTPPFREDVVLAGPGYADLWFRSDAADTPVADADIEVVITAVQPDGTEWLVQNGVLRASHRKVDEARSTDLLIEPSYAAADTQKLPSGQFVEVKVPIVPVSQVFRAGTRLRLIVNTPGRDTPLWHFANLDFGDREIRHAVARGGDRASSLVLPVLAALPDGVVVPRDPPPCPSLRGQVCRRYTAITNESGS